MYISRSVFSANKQNTHLKSFQTLYRSGVQRKLLFKCKQHFCYPAAQQPASNKTSTKIKYINIIPANFINLRPAAVPRG